MTAEELVIGLGLALGADGVSPCPRFDFNGDDEVTVDELVRSVVNSLESCPIAIVSSGTKVLGSDASAQIDDIDEDFTLRFSVPPETVVLSPGDIVVSGVTAELPLGLLRRVASVEEGGRIVRTEEATLEDLFEEASIHVDVQLDATSAPALVALAPGVSIGDPRGTGAQLEGFFFEINDLVLYDRDGNTATTGDQLRVSGSVAVDPRIAFDLEIRNFRLERIRFVTTATATGQLRGHVAIPIAGASVSRDLVSRPLTPFVVPGVGVPVVIVPWLKVRVGVEAELAAGIEAQASYTSFSALGALYEDRTWVPISDWSVDFDYQPPSLAAGGEVQIFAGPDLSLLFYGVVGPNASIDGSLELEADLLADPWWSLYGGLRARVGVRGSILGHDVGSVDFPAVIGYRRLLAQAADPMQTGLLAGSVIDAVRRLPLADVEVTVRFSTTGEVVASGQTGAAGTYAFPIRANAGYRAEFSKPGFLPATYNDIEVGADSTTILEAVLQIDGEYAGPCSAAGTIVDALSGRGVSGLVLALREGIQTTAGATLATTSTVVNGAYLFADLVAGNYTAEVSGNGYNATYFTVICIGGRLIGDQNATVTPVLAEGEKRIVLTWGQTPSDLDSHLTGPLSDGSRFHLYWPFADANSGSPWPTYVTLDLDDTTSFGPETTTILQQIPGVYRFSVHDYTNRNAGPSLALSRSGAQVRFYSGSDLVGIFNVPPEQGGTLWTVFEMNGDTVVPINAMSYESAPSNVRSRAPRDDAPLLRRLPEKEE